MPQLAGRAGVPITCEFNRRRLHVAPWAEELWKVAVAGRGQISRQDFFLTFGQRLRGGQLLVGQRLAAGPEVKAHLAADFFHFKQDQKQRDRTSRQADRRKPQPAGLTAEEREPDERREHGEERQHPHGDLADRVVAERIEPPHQHADQQQAD